ncbi:UDP-3-O-acylglucosamine N-acyltransferase [Dissulfurispira thermophila]|uniref:UDP-3-O-acylglucosamine N-acyltransferase n=1 Tax=Dissulfurispira thermophila TaxID=2715679 RepID=A0A7G1GY94_9BACT|nr:UDP-3-O-(3-hydroxymyristoyl)glucosamine N-acyltransferase [Dissulfurispira thermophila]BCB95148.1 UDP-3-O-acylglucosamine N-acyltransferase [Dissulfurispira thermophila]
MKLKDIANLISGEIVGDRDLDITGVAGILDAKEGDITFVSGKKNLKSIKNTKASAVIVREYIRDLAKPQVIVKNPHYAFAQLLSHFYVRPHQCMGISKNAFVSNTAVIGQDVTLYPFVYVSEGASIGRGTVIYPNVFIGENTSIGENCLIYPNVTIREGVFIGNRVIIQAGAVIGSDGFGYVLEEGVHQKIPQIGGVIIEDDVEIGSNVTIDRATTGNTIIGKGTKIDNLVQIGHNVTVGKNVILVAQVGIAGSSIIGDGVVLGGQVGVADHTTIEAGTMIGAKGGAMGEMKRDIYSGILPMPHREWLRAMAVFTKLPELNKKIHELEEKLKRRENGRY